MTKKTITAFKVNDINDNMTTRLSEHHPAPPKSASVPRGKCTNLYIYIYTYIHILAIRLLVYNMCMYSGHTTIKNKKK